MHGGSHQLNNDYVIRGNTMSVFDLFKDFGVMRSANGLLDDQCSATAVKASQVASAIKYLFQQNTPQLLWLAFTGIVLPMLSYGAQAWSPYLAKDINTIEHIQKHFTKSGLHELDYKFRLLDPRALSLLKHRTYTDTIVIYKANVIIISYNYLIQDTAQQINCELKDLEIVMSQSIVYFN